ncbi:uncharacterized protein EAE98_008446 [Botrytis deweyae]|uniref:Inhibitor I9 domain-containing protein n=1 Tax=Botrytis deweyae TaxID=2478750 RepID=A0ABQ7IE88_9HELO|nr:uncharacterized protein EAE98_008446 [Botrytis deweyae]KAF7921599.1 hypothetical protein EAE98_008446 [Botrytis deweyae]
MSSYIVGVKKNLSEEQYTAARKAIEEQGCEVKSEYDRTGVSPGFVVEMPEGTVTTLEAHDHVEFVEANGEVTTQ